MPGNNWDRVQEVFLEAADLPLYDRVRFLDETCADDPDLRTEVESLLWADTAGAGGISEAIESEVNSLLHDDVSLIGTRLGRYRLVKEIGRGGMGSVFLAERDDEHFHQTVAIKIVKRGMDSAEVLARFRHERQILAGLEHPYIARLIDGGTTDDGRPFFVMERVEGRPIDVYCREQNLSVEARLRLFVRVCEAISYAHRALVVHRDLKPSNILVTSEGIPKLLDFGVAKLLGPSLDPGLTSTWSAMGPLTPEYASPEQIQGLPITTAADTYALGAILFELLTGRRAQKIAGHSPAEIERVVCHVEIPAPSAVEKTSGLSLKIDSDLDNIVLMALRKEPERRYRSVNQFAEDIAKYLAGRPVLAQQDSFVYRSRKFLRRHALLVAAAALVTASLVGGTALALMQAKRAETARGLAEMQRQSAERERARAEAQTQIAEQERVKAEAEALVAKTEQGISQRRLAQMLELSDHTLFDVHSAIEKLPGATEARRKIVATTLSFLEDLSKDAAHDDRLRFMLSVSYLRVADVLGHPLKPNLGDSKGADENYRKSVAMIEPLVKQYPDNGEYLRQMIHAEVQWAILLSRTGEQARAIAVLKSLMPMAPRLPKLCPKDPDCWMVESEVYSELLETNETIDSGSAIGYSELQVGSLEKAHKQFPDNSEVLLELASAYSQNAKLHNVRGELRESVDGFRRAMSLREEEVRRNPSDVLLQRSLMITYGNLAGTLGNPIYLNLGDSEGARLYYGKALAIARQLAAADANNQLAQYDLANALLFSSCLDLPKELWPEALAHLTEAETIMTRLVAADPKAVKNLRWLSTVQEFRGRRLMLMGQNDEAIATLQTSMENGEKGLTRAASDLSMMTQVVASEEGLSEALARKGDADGALSHARAAVAKVEKATAPDSDKDRLLRLAAIAYQNLAVVQSLLGDWNGARASAELSITQWQRMVAMGSHRVESAKMRASEELVQQSLAHLK
ncbi:serine/threonine protein kinase with TPR repeats [Candidatus Koribacter versatilis Ellin345]|uniref:Serine/threonine protein kinase with TPR repeats n=1 Tax=Koribacter versatilis (strain Ellin345) TaxID=204669 RepID=Q1IJA1_KORVE|nr:serine/threonine-protein kinase [Candidatus Koribacter versatilis]ABF43049.1 serine/threonine protein kinase with TPR repeats [Candidatus Koribacter versatilis Ellin345]